MKKYYVYILHCYDDSYYAGVTNHNKEGSKSTAKAFIQRPTLQKVSPQNVLLQNI